MTNKAIANEQLSLTGDQMMTHRILSDAQNLKKLIREAEALADESMIAFARLKQAMLSARQNPQVEVHTGQRALMRLNQAEDQAIAMSTSLLRVHDELSKVAVETMVDDTVKTPPSPMAIDDIKSVEKAVG
ncbi:hypothetical protein [uncultured Erythrobacter sp.]|uniref:hypothetical protein n=1 Tax=uncultured Erythrobacter sp. TaxID=263913 RepID=UPI002628099F|nr:hypothetical protein [uncultured Erythrobacter sp.]